MFLFVDSPQLQGAKFDQNHGSVPNDALNLWWPFIYPHARPGTGRVPTPSSGLRVRRCKCTAVPLLLLLLASKTASRSTTSAARYATARRMSSGITLASPPSCRTKGLPMAKGGVVTKLVPPDPVLRHACSLGEHCRKVKA